jgi:L-aspartate oxidase
VVSRAIVAELARIGDECVFLDTSHIPEERFRQRFPTIYGECGRRGVQSGLIPVRPVQHYQVGGVRVDLSARTTVPGLYAVGEVSCTGVHGANRLASNSMLECLVFGRRAAEAVNSGQRTADSGGRSGRTAGLPPEKKQGIRKICDSYAGVVRDVSGLARGLEEINGILSEAGETADREWLETYNMAVSARAVLSAALQRRESAGTHYIKNAHGTRQEEGGVMCV